MLHFQCPSCQTRCEAAPEFAGKLVVCPQCGQSVSVPRDATAITEDAPPLPGPKRDIFAGDEHWPGQSIAKDGGAVKIWVRNGVYALVGLSAIVVLLSLLGRGMNDTYTGGARTQSINNLKNIALACHSFHDMHKHMPFNGSDVTPADVKGKYTKEAVSGSFTSGSWAFQILPFIDQAPLFNEVHDPKAGISYYMCPARGRPTSEAPGGPWTDYFYNNYLNDPLQAANPNAPDARRTLAGITDGTSTTILAGHGNINTTQSAFTANVVGSSNIFLGGTIGTTRSGDNGNANPTGIIFKRDSAEDPGIGSWGGPYSQGALMAMGDATVRMFPYAMRDFSAFLTPTGGENVVLPDT
jgi:hypothetical protein